MMIITAAHSHYMIVGNDVCHAESNSCVNCTKDAIRIMRTSFVLRAI